MKVLVEGAGHKWQNSTVIHEGKKLYYLSKFGVGGETRSQRLTQGLLLAHCTVRGWSVNNPERLSLSSPVAFHLATAPSWSSLLPVKGSRERIKKAHHLFIAPDQKWNTIFVHVLIDQIPVQCSQPSLKQAGKYSFLVCSGKGNELVSI